MSTSDDSQWGKFAKLRHFWHKRRKFILFATAITCSAALFAAILQVPQIRQSAGLLFARKEAPVPAAAPEIYRWGLPMSKYQLFEDELRSGDILGKILIQQGMTYPDVLALVDSAKTAGFNITSMRIGKALNFLTPLENAGKSPEYMVYEPSPYEFVVFHLTTPIDVYIVKRDVKVETVTASGVLETSFWQALTDNGLSDELADGMIDILSTSVDFYHQKQGDRFKLLYEQHIVEGKAVGTGKIIAAVYERDSTESYAFNFEASGQSCKYYDFEGRPARKAFLKAPLKVSRISSRYNLKRLHPILGYHKAHFGTDYAAPHGTPIMSVADGTVEEAGYSSGNGNYIKIRHDKTYQTQYLHMSRFASGVRRGTRVAQGQTIGYVGSTGLATGPHVCFRFWKNGQQVDHLRLNLPAPEPIKGQLLDQYKGVRDSLKIRLDGVPYRTREEIMKTTGEKPS